MVDRSHRSPSWTETTIVRNNNFSTIIEFIFTFTVDNLRVVVVVAALTREDGMPKHHWVFFSLSSRHCFPERQSVDVVGVGYQVLYDDN